MSNDEPFNKKDKDLKKPTPSRGPADEELGEEAAHLDDAVIGRVFRRSFAAFLSLVLLAGIGYWYFNRTPSVPAPKITQITAPKAAALETAEVPAARFTDVTAESGITFTHQNGAYGEKLLPETMGGGVAFLDFDGDGDQDLLFVNGTAWPWKASSGARPTLALYRNDGRGHFEDVTAGSGLEVRLYGMGVAVGGIGWMALRLLKT